MLLQYPERDDPTFLLPPVSLPDLEEPTALHQVIKGENLGVLQFLATHPAYAGKIDLIYIDPPYATGIDFRVEKGRTRTISHSKKGQIAYKDRLTGGAFLEFLRLRLRAMRELLSPQGSIYVHVDEKVGSHVRLLLDEVFGAENYRSSISRIKCNPKNFRRIGYGNIKDVIFFYSKGKSPIWNEPYEPYTDDDLQRLYPKKNAAGRRYTTIPLHAPGESRSGATSKPFRGIDPPTGRHWRTDVETLEAWDKAGLIEWSSRGNPRKIIYADEQPGKRVQDIWRFKDPAYPDYPTQKNADLLTRIVEVSSNKGSLVLDAFCGSGSTLLAAAQAGRIGIGIDESEVAMETIKRKFQASGYEYKASICT